MVVGVVNSLCASLTNSAITPNTNLLQQVSVYQTVNSFTGRYQTVNLFMGGLAREFIHGAGWPVNSFMRAAAGSSRAKPTE